MNVSSALKLGRVPMKLAAFLVLFGLPTAVLGQQPAPPQIPASQQGKKDPTIDPEGLPEWVRDRIEATNGHCKTFKSKAIGQEVSYFIYLPAAYEQSKDARFPVLYWLHGMGGGQGGIPVLTGRFHTAIEAGKMPSMLIVFVNGMRNSFYCDSADGKTPVESVVIKDLIPHIDTTYRTIYTTLHRGATPAAAHGRATYPKLTLVVETHAHLIVGAGPGWSPAPDAPIFAPAMRQAAALIDFVATTADAGFDAEAIHRLCREELGMQATNGHCP